MSQAHPQNMSADASPSTSSAQPPRDGATCPRGIQVRIPADAEWVRVVRLTVAGVASRMGFSYDDVEDIKLAVSEACNNAILHASPHALNGSGAPGAVTIELIPHSDRIEIMVEDEGMAGAPGMPDIASRQPFKATSIGELPEGGMGLLIIRSLMDDVEQSGGAEARNRVRMVKAISGDQNAL